MKILFGVRSLLTSDLPLSGEAGLRLEDFHPSGGLRHGIY